MILQTCLNCGHVGRYKSRELADHHFARHSCALVRERRARARRREGVLASAGEKRDCACVRAQHQHGQRITYVVDKCRCHDCKVAQRRYEQDRRRDQAYGRTTRVDAEPTRQHLRHLMSQGMGMKRIAEVSGVSNSVITAIIYGVNADDPRACRPPRKRLEQHTAARLLAVQLDLASGAIVDSTGTMRRIRALVAIGWSQSQIAQAIGTSGSHLGHLVHGRRDTTRRTADAVTALYDRWWNQKPATHTQALLGAHSRSVRYAAEHGWPPPLAWDDDTIDDPEAEPATATIRQRMNGSVAAEDVEWLLDGGLSLAGVLDRLQLSKTGLQHALTRQGRRDVWERISADEARRRETPRRVA